VKALEEYGIGRPSTYASIIQTLLFKKYCELVNRRFVPTDLGKIVNRFLTGNFEHYVDYGFTASMEDELDNISRGEEDWVPLLERFWSELKKQVDDVEENVTRSDVSMARDLGTDPASGRPVSVRYGKYGAFAQIGTRDDAEKPRFARHSSCSSFRGCSEKRLTASRFASPSAGSDPTSSSARSAMRRSRRTTIHTRSRSSGRRP